MTVHLSVKDDMKPKLNDEFAILEALYKFNNSQLNQIGLAIEKAI